MNAHGEMETASERSPLERALFELRVLLRSPQDLQRIERIATAKQAIKAAREALYASRPEMINPLTGRATLEARALFREAAENAGWEDDDLAP